MTKDDDIDPVIQLQAVTYIVIVVNDGPDDATNVSLIDTLPNGVTFESATPGQGVCGAAGDSVVCDLESIATGYAFRAQAGRKPRRYR